MSHQQIIQEGADKKSSRNQRQTLGYSQKLQSKKTQTLNISIFLLQSSNIIIIIIIILNLERHFRELEKLIYEEHWELDDRELLPKFVHGDWPRS